MPFVLACDREVEQQHEQPQEQGNLGTIGAQYLDSLAAADGVSRFHCSCRVQDGDFDSVEECVAYIGGPTVPPVLAECYARVLDGFEQVREHIECQAARNDALLECLDAAGCNAESNACQQAAEAACPTRPYEVEAAIAEACLGYTMPEPFVCGDGTKLVPWMECNFARDCPDGTDEYAECPGAFACGDEDFISQEWVCDGFQDCDGGADEADCMMEQD
ncbi:MAG: LDL receptor domain-containing protein [Enhygromyxa sp.]